MKNATEWVESVRIDSTTDEFLIKTIEAIQADALQHAASIANEYRDYDQSRDSLPIVRRILASIPE